MNVIKDGSGILFMKEVFHITCASRKEYLLIQSHFFSKYRVTDGRGMEGNPGQPFLESLADMTEVE